MPDSVKANEVELSTIREELRGYGIAHERVDSLMVELIQVGQQVICASLGEVAGATSIAPETLKVLIATLVAHGK